MLDLYPLASKGEAKQAGANESPPGPYCFLNVILQRCHNFINLCQIISRQKLSKTSTSMTGKYMGRLNMTSNLWIMGQRRGKLVITRVLKQKVTHQNYAPNTRKL